MRVRPSLVGFHSSALETCSIDLAIAQTALRAVVLSLSWMSDVRGLLLCLGLHRGEVAICRIRPPLS